MKYRKKPIEITAIQWDGNNWQTLATWTDGQFNALDDQDRENADDPDWTAQVLDDLHSTWVGVYTGDWIIRGVKGEFYPCRGDVFAETYEPA